MDRIAELQADYAAFTNLTEKIAHDKANYVAKHRKRFEKDATAARDAAHDRLLGLIGQLADARDELGPNAAAWNRLRAAAIARDGFACRRCGKAGTVGTLTVHLRPEFAGNHRIATLDDLTTLCVSCHGSVDAPRAHHPQPDSPASLASLPSIG